MGTNFGFYQEFDYNILQLKEKSKSFENFSSIQMADHQGRNFDLFEDTNEDSKTILLDQVSLYLHPPEKL